MAPSGPAKPVDIWTDVGKVPPAWCVLTTLLAILGWKLLENIFLSELVEKLLSL